MKTALACLAATAALALTPADAAPKPKWEVGVGGFATYGPDFWGSGNEEFGGFPVAYISYRGEGFSILSNGLFDVNASDTNRFSFGISLDGSGGGDRMDDYGLPDIDPVLEVGPEITFALFANGTSRLEVSLAARAAYQWGEGFEGWVIEPSVSYLTTLSETTRLGFTVTSKFGSDDYNDLWYTDGMYVAEGGYIGTSLAVNLVHDINARLRFSAQAKAIFVNRDDSFSPILVTEETNYAFRLGFTYSIWQSQETVD